MVAVPRKRFRGGNAVDDLVLGSLISQTKSNNYSTTPVVCFSFSPFSEETADEIHTAYPHEGGPFYSGKTSIAFEDAGGKSGYFGYHPVYGGRGEYYSGTWRASVPSNYGDPLPSMSEAYEDASSHGPDAWNRFRPKIADVGLNQFIGELRDAPRLMLKKLRSFRSLGNNYLAVEFGWKPFLRDLKRWYKSVKDIDRRIATLQRTNGKWLKRGGTLLENNTPRTLVGEGATALHVPSNYTDQYSWKLYFESSERVWFKGSFRYFIPGLDNPKWGRLSAVRARWGLNVTPALVYELTPWTWLVDWFSNLGSLVGNFSAISTENLTAKYAYIMRSTSQVTTRDCFFRSRWSDSIYGSPYTYTQNQCSASLTLNSKTRCAASPFGFGLSLPDLTAWQTSILAALGLSRLKV